MEQTSTPSFSVVLETANLSVAAQDDLIRSLDSLARQDPSPAQAREFVILDSGDADPALLQSLLRRYPWARIEIIPPGTGYGDQKALCASFTTGDVIIFVDSDCDYEPGCFRSYLDTFARRPDILVQAGETAILIKGPFTLAMGLVYFFPRFSFETQVAPARGFYGNNVAFRREGLTRCPFPAGLPIYRGQNVIHSRLLREASIEIWRQPGARSAHSPPEGFIAALKRFWLTGLDTPRLSYVHPTTPDAPFQGDYEPYHRPGGRLLKVLLRVRTIARQQPLMLLWFPLSSLIAASCIASFFLGLLHERLRPGVAADSTSTQQA